MTEKHRCLPIRVGQYEAERFGIEPGTAMEPWRYTMLRDIYDPGSYAAVLAEMGDDCVYDGLDLWASIRRHAAGLVPADAIEPFKAELERMRQICVAEALKRGLPLLVDFPAPETRH